MVNININKCVGCGLCTQDCVRAILELKDNKAYKTSEKCILCGHCVAICPQNAITIDEYDMSEVETYNKEACHIDGKVMLDAVKFRRSIRNFKDQQVEKEKIEKIIEAGRYSPTAKNTQNVSYIVVQNQLPQLRAEAMKSFRKLFKLLKTVSKVVNIQDGVDFDKINIEEGDFLFKGAPTLILVVSEHPVNASIASANMEMVATAQGIGVLYVGFFTRVANKNRNIKKVFGIKGKKKIVTCLAIGYPNVEYRRSVPRKKADIQWK